MTYFSGQSILLTLTSVIATAGNAEFEIVMNEHVALLFFLNASL